MAQYGKAFGMDVVAWSQNLTVEDAAAAGVLRVDKAELFATSDVVSLHLVLSERSRHVVGPDEIAALKPGAILVNTARGPLIHRDSLLERLRRGDLLAGLDVYDVEPPPADDALRSLPNVVLSPHLGYSTHAVFAQFYQTAVDNVVAFLDGAPVRVITPVAPSALSFGRNRLDGKNSRQINGLSMFSSKKWRHFFGTRRRLRGLKRPAVVDGRGLGQAARWSRSADGQAR